MTTTITGATGVNQITDDAITAAKLPAGSVLQVVGNTRVHGDDSSTTSTSYVDSGLITGTITPVAAGSKFTVMFGGFHPHFHGDTINYGIHWKVFRSINGGAYAAYDGGGHDGGIHTEGVSNNSWVDFDGVCQIFDSPSYTLTNTISYKIYMARHSSGNNTGYMNHTGGANNGLTQTTRVTIQEIAG